MGDMNVHPKIHIMVAKVPFLHDLDPHLDMNKIMQQMNQNNNQNIFIRTSQK
jgi:hypothetical protein